MTQDPITPDRLVLLVIDEAGGRLKGKTLLQKRGYFLSQLMGWALGYRAHYYGPYSPALEDGLGQVKALGFVDERVISFGASDDIGLEVRRYDYILMEDGKKVVGFLGHQHPSQCVTIRRCLQQLTEAGDDGDYVRLSIAAKTHHILAQQGSTMTVSEMQKSASRLGWKITPKMIDDAISFLGKMGLVSGIGV